MNLRLELVPRCILEAMTIVALPEFTASPTHLLLLQIGFGQNLARVVREHREFLVGLSAQLEDGCPRTDRLELPDVDQIVSGRDLTHVRDIGVRATVRVVRPCHNSEHVFLVLVGQLHDDDVTHFDF